MIKIWDKDLKIRDKVFDKIGLRIYQRLELFNPFAKRECGVIIPIFNILPQVGILFDRTMEWYGLRLGWLMLSYELNIYYWRYFDKYVKQEYERRMKDD